MAQFKKIMVIRDLYRKLLAVRTALLFSRLGMWCGISHHTNEPYTVYTDSNLEIRPSFTIAVVLPQVTEPEIVT